MYASSYLVFSATQQNSPVGEPSRKLSPPSSLPLSTASSPSSAGLPLSSPASGSTQERRDSAKSPSSAEAANSRRQSQSSEGALSSSVAVDRDKSVSPSRSEATSPMYSVEDGILVSPVKSSGDRPKSAPSKVKTLAPTPTIAAR